MLTHARHDADIPDVVVVRKMLPIPSIQPQWRQLSRMVFVSRHHILLHRLQEKYGNRGRTHFRETIHCRTVVVRLWPLFLFTINFVQHFKRWRLCFLPVRNGDDSDIAAGWFYTKQQMLATNSKLARLFHDALEVVKKSQECHFHFLERENVPNVCWCITIWWKTRPKKVLQAIKSRLPFLTIWHCHCLLTDIISLNMVLVSQRR